MEKENKKATASEKLTKVVAIRISQTDYDIFLEKAKMENPESTKINISKYLCSVLHDSTISNFHFLKRIFVKSNRPYSILTANFCRSKKFGRIFLSGRNVGKNL